MAQGVFGEGPPSTADCQADAKAVGQGPGTVISGYVQHGVEMGQHGTAPTGEHFWDSRMQIHLPTISRASA